jgi:hypothetical protein
MRRSVLSSVVLTATAAKATPAPPVKGGLTRRTCLQESLYCLWKNAECSPPSGGLAAMCCVT